MHELKLTPIVLDRPGVSDSGPDLIDLPKPEIFDQVNAPERTAGKILNPRGLVATDNLDLIVRTDQQILVAPSRLPIKHNRMRRTGPWVETGKRCQTPFKL